MPRVTAVGISLFLLGLSSSPGFARSAQVRQGVVESVDAESRQVTLLHGTARAKYHVPLEANLIIGRKPAELQAFHQGMKVQVRHRVATTEPLHLYDMTDVASWPWLVRMRGEVVSGQIVEVTPKGVVFEDAADHGRLAYRVTDKTRIELGGRKASREELGQGMKVWIAPRLLPNGSAMATAMGDTKSAAERLRERSRPTVSGTVQEWDAASRKLTLHTVAGDTRILALPVGCAIRREGKNVDVSHIRKGLPVTAHVQRSADGTETVRLLTIKPPTKRAHNTTSAIPKRR